MRARRVAFAGMAVLISGAAASAWNNTGHMAVALIAFRQLRPATRAKVLEILKAHPAAGGWKAPEGTPPSDADAYVVLKAATWPDFIRDADHPGHEDSRPEDHFINFPCPDPKDFPVPPQATREAVLSRPNILARLASCAKTLRDPRSAAADKAKDLSWLLHLVGDVHQPLHCAARFSPQFPDGDRGGNDVIVASEPGVTVTRPEGDAKISWPNLHSSWDRVLGSAEDPAGVRDVADLCQAFPRRNFAAALKKTGFADWADESVALAVEDAYGKEFPFLPLRQAIGLLSEKASVAIPALPPEYLRSARGVAERRVALAGYRLADLLETLLNE
jgi:hypothetical protein